MAFQLVDPAIDRVTQAWPERAFRIGPLGPVVEFSGPDDWARFRIAPREWHPPCDAPEALLLHAKRYYDLYDGVFLELPLAVNAQGQVGYDQDWALLACLSHDKLPLSFFRDVLKISDPCVAFPNDKGPGEGYPLPFAILNSKRRSDEQKMRLLACLPGEALHLTHQGQTLTEMAATRLPQASKATAYALLVWIWATTRQPFPETLEISEALNKGLTPQNGDDKKNLDDMLISKPFVAAMEAVMNVKLAGNKAHRLREKMAAYMLNAPRIQAAESVAPTASRRRFRS